METSRQTLGTGHLPSYRKVIKDETPNSEYNDVGESQSKVNKAGKEREYLENPF